MTTVKDFKLTAQYQRAENFGLPYFKNGWSEQTVYHLYMNGMLIKTHTACAYLGKKVANVEMGISAVNGQECIYKITFNVKPIKGCLNITV